MATTVPVQERHVHHDNGSSAASVALLAVAVVVIAGLTLYALQMLPFQGAAPANDGGTNINVDAELPTDGGAGGGGQ